MWRHWVVHNILYRLSHYVLAVLALDLLGSKWSEIYDIKDPTLIESAITDIILSVLDKHAPITTFKTGGNKKGKSNQNQIYEEEIQVQSIEWKISIY